MGHLINRTARLYRQLADQRLEPYGLSSGQLPVITALMTNESMSQKELTEHAGIEQPTMAATLSRMERDAIIERRPDPNDGRSVLFSLSKGTRSRAQAIKAVIERINADSLEHLSVDDGVEFRKQLVTIIASIEMLVDG